jgi:DNA-binding beta-propeller fold protein YncE
MSPRADAVLTRAIVLLTGVMMSIPATAQTPPAPLVLEAKILLGPVSGRIDHLAIDLKRKRLLVAELGNNSLGVVDLADRKVLRTLTGFNEPQGVGYEPVTDTVYVANAGDGSVRILQGEDFSQIGRIDLGDDADNVRIDTARSRVLVGYGAGALAILDPATKGKIGDIRLKAHPESFQIDGDRAFVNVPDARLIEIADLAKNEVVGAWPIQPNHSNFPMAIDRETHRLFVVFRSPVRLVIMSTADGHVIGSVDAGGDADDVFVDTQRHRIYVTCGAGIVDVFEDHSGSYQRIGQISTAPGARTSLFVPEMDRLFVAVRAAGGELAALWVYRPAS